MRYSMVTIRRTQSGLWAARKVIPEDVRDDFGKREKKKTWPAHLTLAQAKTEAAEWVAEIEAKIDLLRKQAISSPAKRKAAPKAVRNAEPMALTSRQSKALAGEWYKELPARHEAYFTEIAGHWDWDADIDAILPEPQEPELGKPTIEIEAPLRPVPFVQEERDRILSDRSLALEPRSAERLLQDMLELYIAFLRLMERRVKGDYGEDPVLATLPSDPVQSPKASPEVSIKGLFEDLAAQGSMAPKTTNRWRNVIAALVDHLGHDDALKVTPLALSGWFKKLTREGLTVQTVKGTYRAAVSRTFRVAVGEGRIPSNPAAGLEVIGPKATETRRKDMSDSEARTILQAALEPQPEGLSEGRKRSRRWMPWIMAYTGARVTEVAQLRAGDIRQEDGVWVFRITPEAGSVKTRKMRTVPIHSHLIDQGILDFAKAGDETPLFYDREDAKGGSGAHSQATEAGRRLGQWVRSLGVTEVQSPNHGWRHRFKSQARLHGIESGVADHLQGHAAKNEGAAYGHWPLERLRAEIEKLPRSSRLAVR